MFTGRRLFFGETDYQTVELVRQARVPSIGALNPEIDTELEGIVRKALAKEVDDRFQSASDLGEALAQYLFGHRMKVTARDIAGLVRETQTEMMRNRSKEPKDSLIDALILDELQKMTSLREEEHAKGVNPDGSMSLDPGAFVDTAGWIGELGAAPQTPAYNKKTPTRPPPMGGRAAPRPTGGDVDSLEQMLEPDRTGLHGKAEKKTPWLLIIVILAVLAAAAAAAVVLMM
jgi:serine/threonine-protein kinase